MRFSLKDMFGSNAVLCFGICFIPLFYRDSGLALRSPVVGFVAWGIFGLVTSVIAKSPSFGFSVGLLAVLFYRSLLSK